MLQWSILYCVCFLLGGGVKWLGSRPAVSFNSLCACQHVNPCNSHWLLRSRVCCSRQYWIKSCFSTSRPCFFLFFSQLYHQFSFLFCGYLFQRHFHQCASEFHIKNFNDTLNVSTMWKTVLLPGINSTLTILVINLYQFCLVLSQWSWFNSTCFIPYLVVLDGCQQEAEHLNDRAFIKSAMGRRLEI